MPNGKITKTILLLTLICALLMCCMLVGCRPATEFTYGTGAPNAESGKDGDYYLDTSGNTLYIKENGSWQTVTTTTDNEFKNTEILLPDTLYACVGQQIEIYFTNIIAYNLDDVLIRTATDLPDCRQLKDKWTGTPQKEGVYALVISLYTKDWQMIASKRVYIIAKQAEVDNPVTALVIGDSTIHAGAETYKLLDLARNDGVDLTLLGTITREEGNNCEGRSGWKASHYTGYAEVNDMPNPFFNPDTQQFDFAYYMTTQNYHKADIVFIQLGINDIFHAFEDNLDEQVDLFISNMQKIISSIHSYNASIKVVINMVIPCCQNQTEFGKIFGVKPVWEYMRNMYRANLALLNAFTPTDNTFISFANAALDVESYQLRDVHPSTEGYFQMATQMYYMMKALMS